MKVLYFARFRQIIGRNGDEIVMPANVTKVGELLEHLAATDAACAQAFSNRSVVRAAADQNHVALDFPLAGVREVAFFPPVTGG